MSPMSIELYFSGKAEKFIINFEQIVATFLLYTKVAESLKLLLSRQKTRPAVRFLHHDLKSNKKIKSSSIDC
jgi:hypothetical protein